MAANNTAADAAPAPSADEILGAVETALDDIADDHKDHDCGTTEIALGLSANVKLKREQLGADAGAARTVDEYEAARAAAKSGPAQVATDKYRRNYDVIFMSKGGTA